MKQVNCSLSSEDVIGEDDWSMESETQEPIDDATGVRSAFNIAAFVGMFTIQFHLQ
jgi:hypothetical protein